MAVHNPYAFIPFLKQPSRTDIKTTYSPSTELKSGFIEVELVTKSKLIIPKSISPVNPEASREHQQYDFYCDDNGQPVIPGSEIRGMLRSVYEAASNSCASVIYDDKDTMIDMRVPVHAALKNRGLLELKDGVWRLWKTKSYKVRVNQVSEIYAIGKTGLFRGVKPGEQVEFSLEGKEAVFPVPKPDMEGYIQYSYPIKQAGYHPRILQIVGEEPIFTWDTDEPYDILKHELDHANDSARRTQKDSAKEVHALQLEHLKEIRRVAGGIIPVWYLIAGSEKQRTCHLSPSSIGRINQVRKWKDLMGVYAPCNKRQSSCPACQLFGFVNEESSVGSRIRITDAHPTSFVDQEQFEKVTLPILSSPKPTAYDFYINRPSDKSFYWNYDFYAVPDPDNSREHKFVQRDDLSPRGRKFYWHGPERSALPAGNQNSTMTALNSNQEFIFRVYFDRVSDKQVKELFWSITLGENKKESLLWQKIGHGRPVGYGSVKLTIKRVSYRKVNTSDKEWNYSIETDSVPEKVDCPFPKENNMAVQALLNISFAQARQPEEVMYPTGSDGQIYSWFAQNRRGRSVTVLPSIVESSRSPLQVLYDELIEFKEISFTAACRRPPVKLPQTGYVYSINGRILTICVGKTRYDFEVKKGIPSSVKRLSNIVITAAGKNEYNLKLTK